MGRRLPPLNGLRALEATGRHLSIKNAADELSVTPAAVGQQVRLLEERTGRKLFQRTPTGLVLTDKAAAAMPLLSSALDLMERATDILMSDEHLDYLTVTVPTSFATRWLVPRLAAFHEVAPEVHTRIDAQDSLVDLARNNVDLAIRFGRGDYLGLVSKRLFPAAFVPVLSPDLLARNGGLNELSDLARYTLLHRVDAAEGTRAPSWAAWLDEAGASEIDAHPGHQISNSALTIDAALAGQGVALVPDSLVREEIAEGRLVSPLAEHARPDENLGYYLVYLADENLSAAAIQFCNWILKVAAEFEGRST